MTEDLNAPLGRKAKPVRRFSLPVSPSKAAAGGLGSLVGIFALWTMFAHDPLGGEPLAIAPADIPPATAKPASPPANAEAGPIHRYDGPKPAQPGTQTITIIDGSSGKKQEVVVPGSAASRQAPPPDMRLLEETRHGLIPKIAADGTKPAEAYASKSKAVQHGDGPRIALIISGLGISGNATTDSLSKLPNAITLAFTPYGNELENFVARARLQEHEVLLQIPMEPFDYPDNDPGPQTLLTSLSAEQNIDRMHWLMSRFQGYVGIQNFMGARFSATEAAIAPVLREAAKRGLIYVDDGTSTRSLTGQIAGANRVPFLKADILIDAVPTQAEIDKALAKLESIARERSVAVGIGTALPATIDRVAKWAKAAASRGVILVPVSAAALKARSS